MLVVLFQHGSASNGSSTSNSSSTASGATLLDCLYSRASECTRWSESVMSNQEKLLHPTRCSERQKHLWSESDLCVCACVCECGTRSSDQTRVHLVRAVQTGPKLYSLQFLWKIKTYNCLWKKENKKQQKKGPVTNVRMWIFRRRQCACLVVRVFFSSFFFQCVCMFHFLNFCLFFLFFLLMFQPSSRGGRRVSQREKKRNLTRFSLSCAFLRDKWWNFSFSPCLIGLLSYSLHIFHSFSSF